MSDPERSVWRSPSLIGAVVVTAMGLVAVGIIGWEQLGARAVDPPLTAEGVPTARADGVPLPPVPEIITAGFTRPVVGVGEVDDPRNELTRCGGEIEWEATPSVRTSVVTPEGLTVTLRGQEKQTSQIVHATCHARWEGRGWRTWAIWTGEVSDMESPAGPLVPVCCREDGLTVAGIEMLAPQGTAWSVQDRGTYWLAYPVGEDGLVHPVWPVEEGASDPPPLVHLDATGKVLSGDAQDGPEPGAAEDEPAVGS